MTRRPLGKRIPRMGNILGALEEVEDDLSREPLWDVPRRPKPLSQATSYDDVEAYAMAAANVALTEARESKGPARERWSDLWKRYSAIVLLVKVARVAGHPTVEDLATRIRALDQLADEARTETGVGPSSRMSDAVLDVKREASSVGIVLGLAAVAGLTILLRGAR